MWSGLEKRTKIIFIAAVAVTVTGLIVIALWAGSPDYVVLFDNLEAGDAGEISEYLDDENVSYRLQDGGGTILVPRSRRDQLRLRLASEGLPERGVAGFEIFDRSQLGTTDFEQRINFYRALSGELSRTIRQMNKIEYARVQITPAEDGLYIDEQEPAKASVLIRVGEQFELSNEEIRSIAHLVSSSVEKLSPERVTISDDRGRLLSARLEQEKDQEMDISDQMEFRQMFESGIERDLNTMLTRVLGRRDFTVTVNADLNFDKLDVKSEEYEPVVDDEGIVRSEHLIEESEEGTTVGPEGVPGTTSNIPQYEVESGEETSRDYREQTVNYEINRRIEDFTQAPGSLNRLSVSVMVDSEDGLEDDQEEAITEAVAAAIGYNPERGDNLSVVGIPFDNSFQQEIEEAMAAEEDRRRRLFMAIGALIVVILIIVFILFRRGRRDEQVEAGEEIDYVVEEAEQEFSVGDQLSEDEKERQKLVRELRNLTTDQPEEISELIKSWMEEG